MEFIKKMKKREFIEMGLKTLAAVLAAFLAIILMEGMIYSIELNAIKKSTSSTASTNSTVAYCIKEDDDKYFVLYRYYNEDEDFYVWSATQTTLTKQQCLDLEKTTVKKVVLHAPNAFIFSITPIHYVVMAVFIAAIGGFFTYKFIALAKNYKKIEEKFEKTGEIELG